MTSRDEETANWIAKRRKSDARRATNVPSSADRLAHQSAGPVAETMERITAYFGTDSSLPVVELADINNERVMLTFGESGMTLPSPFVSEGDDQMPAWSITHEDATDLPSASGHAWQMESLAPIGTTEDKSLLLVNVAVVGIMGIAGTSDYVRGMMIGQVIEQATLPWTREHHIWLVGFGEVSQKLIAFLARYHDERSFHAVDSLTEISREDLAEGTATLYLLGADSDTQIQFAAIRNDRVGLVADKSISDDFFLSEDDDDTAILYPADLAVFPSIITENHDIYRAMELSWDRNEREAAEAAADIDPSDFLTQLEAPQTEAQMETEGETDDPDFTITDEDLQAFLSGAAAEHGENAASRVREHPGADEADTDTGPDAQVGETHEGRETTENLADLGRTMDTAEQPAVEPQPVVVTASKTDAPITDTATDDEQHTEIPETDPEEGEVAYDLQLMGELRTSSRSNDLQGQTAEAVAFVVLSSRASGGGPVDAAAISAAMWPDDATEGNTSRVRRARLAKKVNTGAVELVSTANGWTVADLSTDVDAAMAVLSDRDADASAKTLACQRINAPLEDAGPWAQEHRKNLTGQLSTGLGAVIDAALETEDFVLAKAAAAAKKRLS